MSNAPPRDKISAFFSRRKFANFSVQFFRHRCIMRIADIQRDTFEKQLIATTCPTNFLSNRF